MPSTQTYYETLKLKADAAAAAKKAAYQQALDRYTTATFGEGGDLTGKITYKKDASGNDLYGSEDLNYIETTRNTNASAEGAGMLRSGQLGRTLANQESAYRANLMTKYGETQAGKTATDVDTAYELAKYKAMYGDTGPGTSSGSGSSATAPTAPGTPTAPAVTPLPTFNQNQTPAPTGATRQQTVIPITGRGGMGSKPVPVPKPVTKKPGTVTLRPGGKK